MKVALSLLLGGAILYWMYRDFDFRHIRRILLHEMNWWWMLLSFPFGILAQTFRGWRWKQSLEPVDEHPRTSVAVNSIFLSYAVSLVVPRMGEFARCGVLKKWDGVSFTKAIGTVVTERAIDSLLVLLIAVLTFLMQFKAFDTFGNTHRRNSKRLFVGRLDSNLCVCSGHRCACYGTGPQDECVQQGEGNVPGSLAGRHVGKACSQRPAVCFLHPCHLGVLLSALLSYVLLLQCHSPFRFCVCRGKLYRGFDSGYRAYPQRRRAVAFCRKNHAYTVWSGGYRRALLRAYCTFGTNPAGGSPGRLRLDSPQFYTEARSKNNSKQQLVTYNIINYE